jgi:hypothetical protein
MYFKIIFNHLNINHLIKTNNGWQLLISALQRVESPANDFMSIPKYNEIYCFISWRFNENPFPNGVRRISTNFLFSFWYNRHNKKDSFDWKIKICWCIMTTVSWI